MVSYELVISRGHEPIVALGMTGASFDSAQRAGVTGIEADIDGMTHIARQVGYIQPDEALPPLVIVTRDSNESRSYIGRWDDRLPDHVGQPNTGRFFLANHLIEAMPPSGNRELFVEFAKHIGATALTEVSIGSWEEDASYASKFAAGLLLAQRPLDLLPKPALVAGFISDTRKERKGLKALKAVKDGPNMPQPFKITRRPAIEA